MRLASPLDYFEQPASRGAAASFVRVMSRGEQLFERAVARIESTRVRAWATSERNFARWLERAERASARGGPGADPVNFATYILLEAQRG